MILLMRSESRIYIGNLDHRITEALLIKMFSPFGKIVPEDFLWHNCGPKQGAPRGFAFIQFSTRDEAQVAKEKMNGRLACGRPLVVRFASKKYLAETAANSSKAVGEANKSYHASSTSGQISRTAKIAAIKNKLKAMGEDSCSTKKQKQADSSYCSGVDFKQAIKLTSASFDTSMNKTVLYPRTANVVPLANLFK
ncbi:hypothetical protein HHK36_029003 [Tetracentron sinense]|uniref:RRM domain-containing protein n=1 Tax=Tetracentron sinense TaxID=13715 RepID=A0A834YDF3_TETSI|nr:hypothetical protein HHK36_029003 [Tetracentron sinense]